MEPLCDLEGRYGMDATCVWTSLVPVRSNIVTFGHYVRASLKHYRDHCVRAWDILLVWDSRLEFIEIEAKCA